MKTATHFKPAILLLALLFSFSSASATIWIVSNSSNFPADFTTLQAAHDGAASGDTIHVLGSVFDYGTVKLTRELHLIGAGHKPLINQPGIVPTVAKSKFTINFRVGSEGSSVTGMIASDIQVHTSDITINRCSITYLYFGGKIDNLMVTQCGIFVYKYIILNSSGENIVFSNNIFYDGGFFQPSFDQSGLFQNNVIFGGLFINEFTGWIVTNNIVKGLRGDPALLLTRNSVQYNIWEDAVTTLNGNVDNVTWNTIFRADGTNEDKLELAVGSPAIGAAQDGGDCGVFGGPFPYIKGGRPALPMIYAIEQPGIGDTVNGLPVTIKARSQE